MDGGDDGGIHTFHLGGATRSASRDLQWALWERFHPWAFFHGMVKIPWNPRIIWKAFGHTRSSPLQVMGPRDLYLTKIPRGFWLTHCLFLSQCIEDIDSTVTIIQLICWRTLYEPGTSEVYGLYVTLVQVQTRSISMWKESLMNHWISGPAGRKTSQESL